MDSLANATTSPEPQKNIGAIPNPATVPPLDSLTAAGIPETITNPADALALVKLIEERVPNHRTLGGGHPLTLPHWFHQWRSASPQWNERGREVCGKETVSMYPSAVHAMRVFLAAGAGVSSSVAAAVEAASAQQVASTLPWWTRRRPRIGPTGIVRAVAAIEPPETIVHPMEGVTLAALIRERVPTTQITFAMKRLQPLLIQRSSMETGGDSPKRQAVDGQIRAIYPAAFSQARSYLSSPEHELVLKAEDRAAAQALKAASARFMELHGKVENDQAPRPVAVETSGALVVTEPEQLVGYVEQARDLLAKCQNITEAKGHLDKAKAVRTYLQSVRAAEEVQSAAEEVVVRVRRRLGELLRDVPKARAGRKQNNRSPEATYSVAAAKATTLSELGVTKQAASKLEKLASIPEPVFERYLTNTRAEGKRPTTRGALALAKATIQPDTSTESYAATQAAVVRQQWSAITRLHEGLQRTASEWSERDAVGMEDHITFNTALASTIGKAIETAPAARALPIRPPKKARSPRRPTSKAS